MEFERGTQSALRAGASSGVSELLTELDAERERLRCGECGGPMVRHLDDVLAALWKHDGNDEARRCAGHCRWVRARWKAPAARWPDASGAAACAGASTAARTPS